MIYPTEWRGDYLYEPILVTELEHQKVIDFSLQTNFVAVLTVSRTSDYQSSPYLRYWSTLRSKAQSQLFKYKTAKTHRSVLLQDVSKTYKSLQQTSRYSNVSTLCEKQKPSVRYSEQSAIKINTGIFLESTMAWSD